MNECSRRVEVHWVHPDTGEMVLQSTPDILHGASFALNSYVGHTFEVRELAAKKTGVCAGEDQTCRVDHFTVNANQDQGEFISCGSCLVFVLNRLISNLSYVNGLLL